MDELRRRARNLVEILPYQSIKDSPTIAYYTTWKYFDNFKIPEHIPEKVGIELHGPFREEVLSERDFVMKADDVKIHAIHYASLIDAKKLIIEESGEYKIILKSLINDKVFESYHLVVQICKGVNAKIEIVEQGGSLSAMLSAIEIILSENSSAKVITKGYPSDSSPSYSAKIFVLADGAKAEIKSVIENGFMHREDVTVYLNGNKSDAEVRVALIGEDSSKIDYYFNGSIFGEDNILKFLGLGLSDDEAYVSIRAFGEASKRSRNGIINLESKTYNIGNKSKAIGVPLLSIRTDNIKEARHSVSISNLSTDVLFYLGSRGLNKDEITELLKQELKNMALNSLI